MLVITPDAKENWNQYAVYAYNVDFDTHSK